MKIKVISNKGKITEYKNTTEASHALGIRQQNISKYIKSTTDHGKLRRGEFNGWEFYGTSFDIEITSPKGVVTSYQNAKDAAEYLNIRIPYVSVYLTKTKREGFVPKGAFKDWIFKYIERKED